MVDRDLRLGLRALRQGIVGPDQLCEAMEELVRRSGSSLSTILRHRGWASESQLVDLERRPIGESTDIEDETDEGGTGLYDGTVDGPMSTIEHRSNKGWSPPSQGSGPFHDTTAG